jgi:hypothetical protein
VIGARAASAEDADFALGVAEIRHWEAEFGEFPRAPPSSCGRVSRIGGMTRSPT